MSVVAKVFKELHTNKASGPNGISILLLRTFAVEWIPTLSPLFQLSVDMCTIPTVWKKAVNIPVPNKILRTGNQ